MTSAHPVLRVGSVPYLVARPLDSGLADEPGIELSHDVPGRLVERLRAGEIDVALVSSIELFRRPGYRYVDGLAVSGNGFVASVQVFLKKPLDEVKTIALDPASRASSTLVQVVLADRTSPPEALDTPVGVDPRTVDADAWLRIGDRALREYHEPATREVFNPSQEWTKATGLPFVFAAWIVRPGVDMEPWLDAFHRSRAVGEARREELAVAASREWSLSEEACREYLLEECIYEPGSNMQEALYTFRDRAARLGLCDGSLAPQPVRDAASHVS